MTTLPPFKFGRQNTNLIAYSSSKIVDLTEIYQSNINVCIVNRTLVEEINHFVKALFMAQTHVSVVESLNIETFDFAKLLPHAKNLHGYSAFYKDIEHLVTLFSELFELKTVGLRLQLLKNAMCPRFHVDHVPCRLVCTYGGLGTEWLEDCYVDRSKLGAGSNGLTDDKSGLIRADSDAINTMSTGAIGLLKGSKWEGNEQNGAVHRSPKITENLPYRLLLTLDFA